MLPFDYPLIRDEIVIDQTVQDFYDGFVGGGPVYLLGRTVTHAQTLRIGSRPLVIVADVYDGSGGMVDASGAGGSGGAGGANGSHLGESGAPGGAGGRGGDGGDVTVYCRRSVNAHISVAGGYGGHGGDGGSGAGGKGEGQTGGYVEHKDLTPWDDTDDRYEDIVHDPEIIPGVNGGRGGFGGTGGDGGDGGTIRFTSIHDDSAPVLEARAGGGNSGGWGGTGGMFSLPEEDGSDVAPPGGEGAAGADGSVAVATLSEADYVAAVAAAIGDHANTWAAFRLTMGEWAYRQRTDPAGLAGLELRRTLDLQPTNDRAAQLLSQWEGGANALGLDPALDVVPSFTLYIDAFTGFGALTLSFLTSGVAEVLDALALSHLAAFADLLRQQAEGAAQDAARSLDIARTEEHFAGDEIAYARQRLDQASADITAEMARMQQVAMQSGPGLGTVAEVGLAVVGMIAAVGTGGAGLVALVPAVVSLASIVVEDAGPLVSAVFAGTKAEVTKTKEEISTAYAKVGKEVPAVVAGAKSVVNFVTVVEKLTAAKTPDNAKYVDLVRRGAEIAHEVLLAQRRTQLAHMRADAAQGQVQHAEALVAAAAALRDAVVADAAAVRSAGLLAIAAAQASAAALLGFAFLAQRSVEIYTLKDESENVVLTTGMLHPLFAREYAEGRRNDLDLVGALQATWGSLLRPAALTSDYQSYFTNAPDTDELRLTFAGDGPEVAALRATGRIPFRVELDDLPAGRYDAKVIGARVAIVGASHPNGTISTRLRHGGRSEQRRPDETVAVQLLASRTTTRLTTLAPLSGEPGFSLDAPLTEPTTFRLWGRGIAAEWELTIPEEQLAGLNLDDVTAVQVWFGYRFLG